MKDRIAKLESRLAKVEERLSILEGETPVPHAADEELPEDRVATGMVHHASTQIGHSLLIFGGAYLLRAITDFQFVPTGLGILMGAIYAVFWLYMAYRQAAVPAKRTSAAVYGGISVVLAMPLIVEAANHFKLLSGNQSTLALTVYFALALAVAVTRNLRTLAWIATAGGIVAGLALLMLAHSTVAVVTLLILIGLGSLWAVYHHDWIGLHWLGGLGANAGVIALAALSTTPQWAIEPFVAAAFATVLLLVYLVSFVIRSLVQGHEIRLFPVAQAPAAAGIAFWATSIAVGAGQMSFLPIGILSIVLGGVAYALAFSAESRRLRRRNYFYYSTLGLLFMLAGTGLIFPATAVAALWSLLAFLMAWLSGRTGQVMLSLQCTFLLLAAAAWSGILVTGLHALAGTANGWPPLLAGHVGVAIATVACLFVRVAQRSDRWGKAAGVPQLIVLALSVWEVGGLIVVFAAPMIAAAGSAEPNVAALAALRTAVLSVAAATLALSSRHPRWPEARWLAYPLLILVGIKLFAEDFPNGNAASLFVALAFVGTALLLAAKLVPRSEDLAEAEKAG
jgi:hypothetical protein